MFANLVLADEVNRAPAKVQSALLEAMQERQVTIGRETHRLPDPFLVMATQNPIESEGTYPLPEAQVDRFMLKVLIDYPSPTEEFVIVERMTAAHDSAGRALDGAQLAALQRAADAVFVDPALVEYAVKLSNATRDLGSVGLGELADYVTYGASPRASINMILAGRAGARPGTRVRAGAGPPGDRTRRAPSPPRALVPGARRRDRGRRGDRPRPRGVPVPELALRERMATGRS